jgi:hypothetical protein
MVGWLVERARIALKDIGGVDSKQSHGDYEPCGVEALSTRLDPLQFVQREIERSGQDLDGKPDLVPPRAQTLSDMPIDRRGRGQLGQGVVRGRGFFSRQVKGAVMDEDWLGLPRFADSVADAGPERGHAARPRMAVGGAGVLDLVDHRERLAIAMQDAGLRIQVNALTF